MQPSRTIGPVDLKQYAEALDVALEDGTPCVLATSDEAGNPNIGLKGSILVLDGDHLAFWERTHGATSANLQKNPHVVVLYRNRDRGAGMRRFFGVVTGIHAEGEEREQVRARVVERELKADPENRGLAVVIRVDRVMEGARTVMQQR